MKKFKTIAALFAATVMLASCGKESVETPAGGDGTTSVRINFSMPDAPQTRAEGAAATAGEASFQPGHVLFVTGSGMIDTHVTIGKTSTISGVTNFTIAELTTDKNVVVEGVSSSATKCYILSNDIAAQIGSSTGITTNLKGSNISQVLNMQIEVNKMNNSPSTLANVPMYGVGDVDIDDPGTTTVGAKPYTATVNVLINSLASRIQIGKISAKDYTPSGTTDVVKIKSFTIDGIYINNTYDKMTPASVVATAGVEIDNGSTVTNYSKAGAGTDYNTTTGTAAMLADEFTLPAAVVSNVLTADQATAANFWAYNVFPKGIPHIIVKLSNITYTITSNAVEGGVQTITGNQWLTIDSYKKSSDSSVLAAFEANNIYTLGDIQFDYADLTDVPETTSLDVLVTVEMFDWIDTPLEWNN
jgi:hypothetical protein